ncbi:hypothetical protein AYK25_06065 [Thermoplasmatales archaeon SM1-50]|nr:MAG: hypothetical protein AYK25_06065 [Thermoplasmatales archaeon SM1-50]
MRVMQRGIMKILPGKMAETMKLNEKYMAIMKRYGVPSMRMYRPFVGGGDYMHTVIFEIEWDSFEKMATFFEKIMEDKEVQEMMPQWEELMGSHEVELYMSMS